MVDRRSLLLASFAALWAGRSRAAGSLDQTITDLDQLGRFEHVLGKPGIVVGVPHATADSGTFEAGRILCKRIGAGGVFVTGFWDPKTRERINVNRAPLAGCVCQLCRRCDRRGAMGLNVA